MPHTYDEREASVAGFVLFLVRLDCLCWPMVGSRMNPSAAVSSREAGGGLALGTCNGHVHVYPEGPAPVSTSEERGDALWPRAKAMFRVLCVGWPPSLFTLQIPDSSSPPPHPPPPPLHSDNISHPSSKSTTPHLRLQVLQLLSSGSIRILSKCAGERAKQRPPPTDHRPRVNGFTGSSHEEVRRTVSLHSDVLSWPASIHRYRRSGSCSTSPPDTPAKLCLDEETATFSTTFLTSEQYSPAKHDLKTASFYFRILALYR
ncbi:hypothetical protein V8E51_003304 [Hyaloscypha variabilis]